MDDQNKAPPAASSTQDIVNVGTVQPVDTDFGALIAASSSAHNTSGGLGFARQPLQPVTRQISNAFNESNEIATWDPWSCPGTVPLTRQDLATETKSLQEALVRSILHDVTYRLLSFISSVLRCFDK